MPCVDGKPREFAAQDELSIYWKSIFPTLRFMTYRILAAVPYDMSIQNKIVSDPDYFVRWQHQPGSSAPGNGSIYVSACFNDPHRINDPKHNCSFPIRAAAYDFANEKVQKWFVDEVIAPALTHADGVWLDGIGPDNGAYMCGGVCCGFGASNSPHNQQEIDAHCDGMRAATTAAQQYLVAHGGHELMKCTTFLGSKQLPTAKDSPDTVQVHETGFAGLLASVDGASANFFVLDFLTAQYSGVMIIM